MTDKPQKRAPRGAARTPKDLAILHGPTEDGEGARMLRLKDGEVYAGELRPAREGQSIEHQELVRLRPLHPRLPVCEVEVLHTPKPLPASESRPNAGPARVSNPRFRRNWNAVFGSARKSKPGDWSVN